MQQTVLSRVSTRVISVFWFSCLIQAFTFPKMRLDNIFENDRWNKLRLLRRLGTQQSVRHVRNRSWRFPIIFNYSRHDECWGFQVFAERQTTFTAIWLWNIVSSYWYLNFLEPVELSRKRNSNETRNHDLSSFFWGSSSFLGHCCAPHPWPHTYLKPDTTYLPERFQQKTRSVSNVCRTRTRPWNSTPTSTNGCMVNCPVSVGAVEPVIGKD